jgi:hypothetical protein
MKQTLYTLITLISVISQQIPGFSQDLHSFQWRCESGNGGNLILHDVVPTENFGYVCGGLAENPMGSNIYYPIVYKLDCQGKISWSKIFNQATETPNNVNGRILKISDTDYVWVGNVGYYFTSPYQDIFVARMNGSSGNVVWSHRIGGGTGFQDLAQSAIVTQDGNIAIAGQTSSFGSDNNSQNLYTDQYFMKLSADGDIMWSRTFGNPSKTDRAFDLVEAADGSLYAAGSYIHSGGTFYANLLKMDADGTVLWAKGFGEGLAPQANHAYGLLLCKDGGLLLTGSSTNNQTNYLDYSDFLAIKTNADGLLEWSRVIAGGAPNSFENASNAIQKNNGEYALSCATNSYPTDGIVGNKHVVVSLSETGDLLSTTAYNLGGSHYPRLKIDPYENAYLMTGFSNWGKYQGNGFRFDPILINMDADMETACHTYDFSHFTLNFNPAFDVDDLPGVSGSGGQKLNNIISVSNFQVNFDNICESNPHKGCGSSSTASTPEFESGIQVYPNPAAINAPVQIRWDLNNANRLLCYDVQGRLVKDLATLPGINNLEFHLETPGIYLIRLLGENNREYSAKLLVHE